MSLEVLESKIREVFNPVLNGILKLNIDAITIQSKDITIVTYFPSSKMLFEKEFITNLESAAQKLNLTFKDWRIDLEQKYLGFILEPVKMENKIEEQIKDPETNLQKILQHLKGKTIAIRMIDDFCRGIVLDYNLQDRMITVQQSDCLSYIFVDRIVQLIEEF